MLTDSKRVNFKSAFRVPVSTSLQCPTPALKFEEVEVCAEPAPVPAALKELLGPQSPSCLDDLFDELISEQQVFGLTVL